MRALRRLLVVVVYFLVALPLSGCATGPLQPEEWLVWQVENLREERTTDDVRWAYELVLHNKGRRAAELRTGLVVLKAGGVHSSPTTLVEKEVISSGRRLRVPHTAVFKLADFPSIARNPGSAAGATEMSVKWLLLGGYQDGGAIILTPEVQR